MENWMVLHGKQDGMVLNEGWGGGENRWDGSHWDVRDGLGWRMVQDGQEWDVIEDRGGCDKRWDGIKVAWA